MGAAVTQALVEAIGGQGTIIMTQGALGPYRCAGPRQGLPIGHRKFPDVDVLDNQPADWDVTKTRGFGKPAHQVPEIDAAFFHNDDMALAAASVMEARGRDRGS